MWKELLYFLFKIEIKVLFCSAVIEINTIKACCQFEKSVKEMCVHRYVESIQTINLDEGACHIIICDSCMEVALLNPLPEK